MLLALVNVGTPVPEVCKVSAVTVVAVIVVAAMFTPVNVSVVLL